jgi:hypothetical protein
VTINENQSGDVLTAKAEDDKDWWFTRKNDQYWVTANSPTRLARPYSPALPDGYVAGPQSTRGSRSWAPAGRDRF